MLPRGELILPLLGEWSRSARLANSHFIEGGLRSWSNVGERSVEEALSHLSGLPLDTCDFQSIYGRQWITTTWDRDCLLAESR